MRPPAPPAVVVLTLAPDELRVLVRDAVREVIAEVGPATSTPALVDRHELARLLGVSPATITRMTGEGMPHVFVGASPRYSPDDVNAWLLRRGRQPARATHSKTPRATIAGVRLLSRGQS